MTDASPTPPGWYPDGNDASIVRYWDGSAWTEQTQPATTAAADHVGLTPAPAKRPWYKRKGLVIPLAIVAGLILISGISSAINGGGKAENAGAAGVVKTSETPVPEQTPDAPATVGVPNMQSMTVADAQAAAAAAGVTLTLPAGAAADWVVSGQDPAANVQVAKDSAVTVQAAAPKPKPTLAQENAYKSAKSYLSFQSFSRAGLIQQLTSAAGEGFAPADAEWAVATIEAEGGVDWNEQAFKSAQSYLSFQSFSRAGLYQQLTSQAGEKFTPEQANYALDKVGLH